MKFRNIIFSFSLLTLLFAACNSEAQNTTQMVSSSSSSNAKIEVIQFHSEHRCMTCNKIEELTKSTLEDYSSIPFSLVNVDDSSNAKQAEQFEAAGTALFLYNPATGKKKELTDFAFMNASNKEKFVEGLKKEIDQFVKQ